MKRKNEARKKLDTIPLEDHAYTRFYLDALIEHVDERFDILNEGKEADREAMANLTEKVEGLSIRVDDLSVRVDTLSITVDILSNRVDGISLKVDSLIIQVNFLTSDMVEVKDKLEEHDKRFDRIEEKLEKVLA
jgi:chromosome segregation ATPase